MRILFLILVMGIISCNHPEGKGETSLSTVDSNTVSTTDTVPSIMYLDNTRLDTFPVAMDSAGPIIQPDDTLYTKQGH